MNAVASSSKSFVSFPSYLGTSLPSNQTQLQYDHRGRLMPFVETGAQKRERLAFLKTQEQSRRVSEWVITSSTGRSKRAVFDSSSLEPAELPGRPDPIPEEDEPSSQWSVSPVSPPTPTNSSGSDLSWPNVMNESRGHKRSSSVCSSRSSRSSLGSILEEDEKSLY
ncbi:hypothetical protein QCA50_008086 [Cerrena zonata]|uniref:Uncharacterized protein n=1 Tax=Cerrena zonata TaxID=2478898 RepID=A0AAW0GEM3_9APHY